MYQGGAVLGVVIRYRGSCPMGDYPLGQLSQGSYSEGSCLRGCCLIIVSKRQDKFQAHLNKILGSMRQSTMFAFSNYVSIHMSAVYYRKQIIIHCQVCKYNVAQRFHESSKL